jgi:hypothetical protein
MDNTEKSLEIPAEPTTMTDEQIDQVGGGNLVDARVIGDLLGACPNCRSGADRDILQKFQDIVDPQPTWQALDISNGFNRGV